MAKKKKETVVKSEFDLVLEALSNATGLRWSLPPETPSLLQNGYHAQTEMLRAAHVVRRLKDAAIEATGRPRAIVFERSGCKNASVNIPKEIAENKAFLAALRLSEMQAAKAVYETRAIKRQVPTMALKPFAMPPLRALSSPAVQA